MEGRLDPVLFAAKFDFRKILVPRIPQNTLDVNINCGRKSCILCFFI